MADNLTTGQMGFLRNLSIGEIIGQVSFFAQELAKEKALVADAGRLMVV